MYRPAHSAESRGRLAAEMRWRLAALLALSGMAAIPAISDAGEFAHAAQVRVTVKPRSGSARTHFAVSFRAAVHTGRSSRHLYRVNASRSGQSGCQSAVTVVAPPANAGATERVVLAPGASKHWCVGTFRGRVWDVINEPCPTGEACPALVPRPLLVGRFTFRVTRG